MTESLRGFLTFHSEVDTEGGFWAFQDERFIHADDREICAVCGALGDSTETSDAGDATPSITVAEVGFATESCPEGEHDWTLLFPDGEWDWEGLHILKDGDQLTIFDKANPDKVVWRGTIAYGPFSILRQGKRGNWIQYDQLGVDRETWARWFMEGNPAVLMAAPE
jgi:hypothetical protein